MLVKPEKTDLEEVFEKGEDEEDEESKKTGKAKNRMRILIVEDEEEILSYLKEELEGDYRIMTRKNGREAYDTILADNS